jgi:hypothetical protein
VSAFYTSNVEFYLFRDGSFPGLRGESRPPAARSAGVIVRSVFPAGAAGVARVPGYNSASLTQNIDVLLTGYAKGQFRQYSELTRQER